MMDKAHSTGTVATASGSRYLQQLCKHWSHRFPVEFDAEKGTVQMAAARVVMTATPAELRVDLEVDTPDDLPRMQKVVSEHLDRFAFREAPLPFVWN